MGATKTRWILRGLLAGDLCVSLLALWIRTRQVPPRIPPRSSLPRRPSLRLRHRLRPGEGVAG